MAPTSQNGYPANDVALTEVFTVPGSSVKLRLRKGVCGRALVLVAAWIDQNVEDIDTRAGVKGFDVPDDWGFAVRLIRGSSTTLSNHASGTAEDLNAVQHPLGVDGTWPAAEEKAINDYLQKEWRDPLTGRVVIRWGQNYQSRVDGMHLEIDADEAAVRRAVAAYDARHSGTVPVTPVVKVPPFPLKAGQYYGPADGFGPAVSVGPGLGEWQKQMRRRDWTITVDGVYGPETRDVALAFQREKHLERDGLIGKETWDAAWALPITD